MVIELKGTNLKQAVKWISEQRLSDPREPVYKLVEKASIKFNLDPQKTEFLYRNI